MHKRRSFLKLGLGAAALGGGALAGLCPPRRALAGPENANAPCKLVIFLAYGGWDTTWALDPKPDAAEVDLVPGDVQMFGDIPIWTHAERPAVSEFFSQWGSRSAVINGVAVESLAHETCSKMMLAGGLGSRPDLAARVAASLGSERALPYLSFSSQAKIDGSEALAGAFGQTNQLMALSTPGYGWPRPGQTEPDMGLQLTPAEREAVAAHLDRRRASLRQETEASPRSARMVDDYDHALRRARDLRSAANQGGVLADPAIFEDTEAPWDKVAGAFAEGLSQCAIIQPDLFWDTHAFNATQGQMHQDFFAGLNALMAALAARDLVDETVVLVASEMGRTPRHNADGGKDHWPWTSAMVVGQGVAGGRVYGSTNEWLQPSAVDLRTGALSEGGADLHAEHVLHAVAKLVGVADPSPWFTRGSYDAILA